MAASTTKATIHGHRRATDAATATALAAGSAVATALPSGTATSVAFAAAIRPYEYGAWGGDGNISGIHVCRFRVADSGVDLAFKTVGRDGAYSGRRTIASVARNEWSHAIIFDMVCRAHANVHLEKSVMLTIGLKLVSEYFSMTRLFRTAGNFVRILQALLSVVLKPPGQGGVEMRGGPPPPGARAYNQACVDMIISSTMLIPNTYRADRRRHGIEEQSKLKYWERFYHRICHLFNDLMDVLNGFWWEAGTLVHHCKDFACCDGYNRAVCANKVAIPPTCDTYRKSAATCFQIPTAASLNWSFRFVEVFEDVPTYFRQRHSH